MQARETIPINVCLFRVVCADHHLRGHPEVRPDSPRQLLVFDLRQPNVAYLGVLLLFVELGAVCATVMHCMDDVYGVDMRDACDGYAWRVCE